MRPIDADALNCKYITISASTKGREFDYMMGWNDAIDAIRENAPTVEPTCDITSDGVKESD